MKNFLAAGFALALSLFGMAGAEAQVVTQLPQYIDNAAVNDFGNGPLELRILQGNAALFSSQSNGVGTASASTALTLTATPAIPPIVGGFITCNVVSASCSIPANTTVAAYNGTTGVTLSAASTITAVQVNWGAACPATPAGSRVMLVQASVGADVPMYTQARICGSALNAPGATVLPFAIGAH